MFNYCSAGEGTISIFCMERVVDWSVVNREDRLYSGPRDENAMGLANYIAADRALLLLRRAK